MPDTPGVFISYARRDGEKSAGKLRERLEREEQEITLWQDRTQMEGGVGWWKQTASLGGKHETRFSIHETPFSAILAIRPCFNRPMAYALLTHPR